MDHLNQRMTFDSLTQNYPLKDLIIPSIFAIASIWLVVQVLWKWKTTYEPIRPSTPDLEKKPPVPNLGRKPGGMPIALPQYTYTYLANWVSPRMDTVVLQKTTSRSVP